MQGEWNIIYTKTNYERKVSDTLTRKKIENFYPCKNNGLSNKKFASKPLFPGYVFVKVPKDQLFNLKSVDGVINIVYWLQNPVSVPDAEIHLIKAVLDRSFRIQVKQGVVNANEIARIEEDAVIEKGGNGLSMNNSFKIILPTIGYYVVAETEKMNVEVFKGTNSLRKQSILGNV